ncbi:MAG: exopolysaccharide biosynthesis protein [Ahrensia sp.]|nr:exopolysaccharide biosynthesis protein [Ahrensia sp.]
MPFPPGSTVILGIPIVIVAWQMVIGRQTVWLPEFFLKRSLSKTAFDKMATKLIPFVQRLEAWIKPRNWPFANAKSAEKIIGIWAVVLGIAVILPVPLGNWFPAISCAVCGAALSERDGILLAIGVVMGIASIIILIAMAAAIFFGFSWAISGL